MKKSLRIFTFGMVLVLALACPVLAEETTNPAGMEKMEGMDHSGMKHMEGMDHSGMEKMEGMDHSGMEHMKDMDHSGHLGDLIHESVVDGYKLAYHLMDIHEKMAAVKGMEHITHHLMLYVADAEGKPVDKITAVGYRIEGPGNVQKKMAMGMNNGFGADVSFKEKGVYTVNAKILAGEKKLVDSFQYEVK